MNSAVDVILEIIKISVPALVVFFTIYKVMGKFLDRQYQMRLLETKEKNQSSSLPIRLQAYERLSLFCERISIPALLLRLKTKDMNASALRYAMMVAIQKEYEHNITQQVYVSNQLWEILKYTKDDTINNINLIADTVDPDADASELSSALMKVLDEKKVMTYDKALEAIKKEAGILM